MADTINTNVFPVTVNGEVRGAKFVDFAGLDYFWSKAKSYVDAADKALSEGVATNSAAISSIQDELNSLSGGAGSIATQIQNAINALKLPETYATIESVNGNVESLTSSITKNSEDIAANSAANSAVAANLASHAADAELHVTKDKQNAWDAATSAINAFLKDSDATEKAVDTLKEIQAYITTDGEASAELLADVAQNKKDIAANSTAISSVVTKMGEDIAAAKSEAIAAAAEDATSKADTAKSEAIAQAKLDAQDFLKSYYTSAQVETKLSETLATAQGYANTAETNAKNYAAAYTNELFGSITFAENGDIDGLFTPATGE
jgi:hypothetical protein